MDIRNAEKEIKKLSELLEYHSKKYYEEDSPEIEDHEYDAMFRRLQDLESEFPQLVLPTSPTHRVGGAVATRFEKIKHEFPMEIQELYDNERTLHDGKWLLIRVDNLETLEVVKKLILLKKKPNRKPLPKETAIWGKCGHRCDLCVHYTGITEELRTQLIPHLNAVYGDGSDWSMRCTGCDTSGCQCYGEENEVCEPLKCLPQKQIHHCFECNEYPCEHATVGYRQLEHRNISADDVTWAILPYVPKQYEE